MVRIKRWNRVALVAGPAALAALLWLAPGARAWPPAPSFLRQLENNVAFSQTTVAPSGSQQGDQNPYGVTVAPVDCGVLHRGDILVSDFNNSNDNGNLQGTGSSIIRVHPRTGEETLFFDAGGAIGLTTALVALRSGLVVVGSAQRVDTVSPPTVSNGSLIFTDCSGNLLLTLTDSALLNGVWDMTVNDTDPDRPKLFISDVLSGTVVRIVVHVEHHKPDIESITKIGSGFAFALSDAALVVGVTGLAWDPFTDDLFVADTANNRIAKLERVSHIDHDQGHGETIKEGSPLFGPLGLVLTPQRTLLTANGDAVNNPQPGQENMAVELSRHGDVIATRQLDNSGTAGALFGITLTEFEHEPSLVYVDDNDNSVNIIKTR
jgi:hypothetical protein